MTKIVFVGMLLAASGGLCQTPQKDPGTLQSLLAEVRQLRQDIEAMTVASQRIEIMLSTLQIQDQAVARAARRLDEVRNKCSAAETNRAHASIAIHRLENELASGTAEDPKTKDLQSVLNQMKSEIEAKTAEVQSCQASESEASSQLQNDQAKLVDLQDRIERLDKLSGSGR
jgi:chromosome segregation ATPase